MLISFKGYDACPIKNIHIFSDKFDYLQPIKDSLSEVSKEEGFGVQSCDTYEIWLQDNAMFVNNQGSSKLLFTQRSMLNKVRSDSSFTASRYVSGIAGGNMFLGKKTDNSPYLLIGRNSVSEYNSANNNKDGCIDNLAKEFGIDPKNVFVISQPNLHLDLNIRPVGYPYVLINDPDMVIKNVKKLKEQFPANNYDYLLYGASSYASDMKNKGYTSIDQIEEELKSYGFIPIRVGGIYDEKGRINFMNAIVHKRGNGQISYLTNGYSSTTAKQLEAFFEEDIKKQVPNLGKIHFIVGDYDQKPYSLRYVLERYGGGLHCMSVEEPDFEAWA